MIVSFVTVFVTVSICNCKLIIEVSYLTILTVETRLSSVPMKLSVNHMGTV